MLTITDELAKKLVSSLELGMTNIFLNKNTGGIIEIPDDDHIYDVDEEAYLPDLEELENNYDEYIEIERISSKEMFEFVKEFVENIDDVQLKEKFLYAINSPKPFNNFKYEINYYHELKNKWNIFRTNKYIEWVKMFLNNQLSQNQ